MRSLDLSPRGGFRRTMLDLSRCSRERTDNANSKWQIQVERIHDMSEQPKFSYGFTLNVRRGNGEPSIFIHRFFENV